MAACPGDCASGAEPRGSRPERVIGGQSCGKGGSRYSISGVTGVPSSTVRLTVQS